MRFHANRSHAGSTTPVGDAESFVEVEMAHVRADDARCGEAHLQMRRGGCCSVHVMVGMRSMLLAMIFLFCSRGCCWGMLPQTLCTEVVLVPAAH